MVATFILHNFCRDKTSIYTYISEHYPNSAIDILFCAYSLATSRDRTYITIEDVYASVNILLTKNN